MNAETVDTNHNFQVALWWAKLGIPVFPVDSYSKTPFKDFLDWEGQATTNENQLRLWWLDWPNAAPALAVGRVNLVVFDADRKPGRGDGVTAFHALCSELGINPWASPVVNSPSSGQHIYYRQNGVRLGNSEGKIRGQEINVRGHGGYVLAPYAVTPFGQYGYVEGSAWFDAIPEIPEALCELIKPSDAEAAYLNRSININAEVTSREQAWAASALSGWCQELSSTMEGGRNNRLNAASHKMAQMVARGWISSDIVWTYLYAAATQCGLSDKEIRQTYTSAFNSGLRKPHPDLEVIPAVPGLQSLQFPGQADEAVTETVDRVEHSESAGLPEGYQRLETGEAVPAFENPDPLADDAEYPFAPGIMGRIQQFLYDQATPAMRQYSIAGGLLAAAAICGSAWNVRIASRPSGLNLYIVLVGSSGTGKSSPRAGISTLISAISVQNKNVQAFVGPKIVSAAGARDYFTQSASYYSQWGEWQSFVDNIHAAGRNTNIADIKSSVLEWYDLSGMDEVLPMTGHKDPKMRSTRVVGPAFSILADTTPNVLSSFSEESITSGFLPRHTFFIYEGPAAEFSLGGARVEPPADLVTYLGQLAQHAAIVQVARNGEDPNLKAQYPTIIATPDTPAMATLEAFRQSMAALQATADESLRQVFNRAVIQAARAAALCAVLDAPSAPVINATHMAWACEVIRRCTLKLYNRLASGRYGKGDRSILTKMEEIIRDRFVKGPSHSYRFGRDDYEKGRMSKATIFMRAAGLEPFKSYPRGATQAINMALSTLEQMGKLYEGSALEVDSNQFQSARRGSRGAVYYRIVDPYLLGR